MNDIYLKVANSQLGKNILEALNLPTPPDLERSPDRTLSTPSGKVLLGYSENCIAASHISKALDVDSIKLFTPDQTSAGETKKAGHSPFKSSPKPTPIRLTGDQPPRFKTAIFDATGFGQLNQSEAIYKFFKSIARGLKHNAKVVVIGLHPDSCQDPEQAAAASGLEGFVKSFAKEIGYKGANCNLVQIEKGAERQIKSALYYLLTDKSAFVSGQILQLKSTPTNRKRFDWEQPLKGKIALVTGAAQGIGEVAAHTLARDGATVLCLDIPANESKLNKVANTINGHPLAIDLSLPDAPEQIAIAIASQMGGIDIVVHNAGITRDKTLGKMPQHFWTQVLNINLEKVAEINNLLVSRKLFKPNARLVCISSISGIAGNFGQTNYAYSKAGVAGYVQAFSKNTENGMTINAIAPGFIETQMTGKIPFFTREIGRRTSSMSQGGLPIDVAEAIAFFCHPASQATNGNLLRVCGQSLLGK